jgi:hypothetical protein
MSFEEMPSSDEQHRLNSRQRREIDQIGQKFHFNLAPPARSLDEITTSVKFVSLADFIERFDWKYSDLDIIDGEDIIAGYRGETNSAGGRDGWYVGRIAACGLTAFFRTGFSRCCDRLGIGEIGRCLAERS